MPHFHPIAALLAAIVGERSEDLLHTLDFDVACDRVRGDRDVSGVAFAAALNLALFDRLLAQVPTGAAFVADQRARGQRIAFDHGAIRTVRFATGPTGDLPPGEGALTRILKPLGYRLGAVYALPKLKMTGRAWVHRDLPEALPQFFVSELHVDRFDTAVEAVARRVFGTSRDPLDGAARAVLRRLGDGQTVSMEAAVAVLPTIVGAFDRQHDAPTLSDYEALLAQSAEAAWIATEGNAFNHATSRVDDIAAEADRQRGRGLSIKDRIEVSQTGRVRQTAFRADPVIRCFRDGDGIVERSVPGSFYEIIARDVDPETGCLDLSFDSGNATGIFQMTKAA